MKKQQFVTTFGAFCAWFVAVHPTSAQIERLIAELGGVQMVEIREAPPGPGYMASRVVLRSGEPSASLVTFENFKITGSPVQTWLSGPFGGPTAKNVVAGPTYPAEWVPFDTHMLISSMPPPTMIGGEAGNGFNGITETNDMSIGQIPGLPDVLGTPPVSGIGEVWMVEPTDAFFLAPPFQTNEVELAYVVISDADFFLAGENVFITVGVLGAGIIDSGQEGGANFGFNGDHGDMGYAVFLVPEPTTNVMAGLASLMLLGIRRWLFG